MIGNDVVDLSLASLQSNWQRKGFLEKVFTSKEKQLILSAQNSFKMVWHLWSMKESAYKVYIQQHQKRFFAPKKFECFLTSTTQGFVVCNTIRYKTSSNIEDLYIYTTATLFDTNDEVTNSFFNIREDSAVNQSKETYQQLKALISKTNKLSYQQLNIQKTKAGVPKIYQNQQLLNIPFSITHHGHFGAISLLN